MRVPRASVLPAPRLAAVVVVGLACLFGPGVEPVAAQDPFTGYGACLNTALAGHYDQVPDDTGSVLDPDLALRAVWDCSAEAALTWMVPLGRGLLASLVLIMLVWRGLQFMYGGSFDAGGVLTSILLIGFAFALIDNYYSPTPRLMPWGVSQGFVALVTQQGVEWSELIIGDADQRMAQAYSTAKAVNAARGVADFTNVATSTPAAGAAVLQFAGVVGLTASILRQQILHGLYNLSTLLLWLISWVVYAQYLWGYFMLCIVTMVGPLFIPLVVIDQLQEYFWGWFKALLQGVLYMLTSAALYAVLVMVLVIPLGRIAQVPVPTDVGSVLGALELVGRMLFEFVPMIVLAVLASLKVSAMTSMVFAGGTPVASGIGSHLAQAESAAAVGAQRVQALRAARAAAPAAAAGPPSSAVGARGVQQAAADLHARVGARAGGRSRPPVSSKPRVKPKGG